MGRTEFWGKPRRHERRIAGYISLWQQRIVPKLGSARAMKPCQQNLEWEYILGTKLLLWKPISSYISYQQML